MLQEINWDLWVNLCTLFVFVVSVIIASFVLKNNKIFHKQKMLSGLVSRERDLRIKLSEYQEKIGITRDKKKVNRLWNDHDNLLFDFYEYLAIIFFGNYLVERDAKIYFQRLLVDVYRAFKDDKGFFSSANVSRNDYPNLMKLFKAWRIDELYVRIVERR